MFRRVLYVCTATVSLYPVIAGTISPYPHDYYWPVQAVLLTIAAITLIVASVSANHESGDRAAQIASIILLATPACRLIAGQLGIIPHGIITARVSTEPYLVVTHRSGFEKVNMWVAPWVYLIQPCLATASLCFAGMRRSRKANAQM